jgi:hypothetical protein
MRSSDNALAARAVKSVPMWRVYGGTILVIAGIAAFIEAHSHKPFVAPPDRVYQNSEGVTEVDVAVPATGLSPSRPAPGCSPCLCAPSGGRSSRRSQLADHPCRS